MPLSETTIYEMEQRNEFPRRIVLLLRVVVWDLAEVEAWLEQRNATRRKWQTLPDVYRRKRRSVRRGSGSRRFPTFPRVFRGCIIRQQGQRALRDTRPLKATVMRNVPGVEFELNANDDH